MKPYMLQGAIVLVGLICATVLAGLKVISGDMAIGLIGGVVFGVASSLTGGKNGVKQGGPPAGLGVLMLTSVLLFGGCVTTEKGEQTVKKVDPCTAMLATQGGHQLAEGASSIVCAFLPEPKRTQCYKYQQIAAGAGQFILNTAATVIKACTVQK